LCFLLFFVIINHIAFVWFDGYTATRGACLLAVRSLEGTVVYFDENTVRQIYAAFNRRDLAAVVKLYADDVIIHVPGRSRISGDHRGKAAVRDLWEQQFALSNGSFQPQVVTVADCEGHIVVISDITIDKGGERFTWRRVIDFALYDGLIHEAWFFENDQYAADQAFS
jgi:ketosteroid isomerase-like protein